MSSTDCVASTTGKGGSMMSLIVASSSFVFSRLLRIATTLTDPTQLSPSMTGSCETSCSVIRRSADERSLPDASHDRGVSPSLRPRSD